MNQFFSKAAQWISCQAGCPSTFVLAALAVLAWGAAGPFFGFSDTWQLVINTGTTIVTFLMVFLIQNSQNRDTKAIHVKLDELIRATADARNELIDLEDASEAKVRDVKRELASVSTGDVGSRPARPARAAAL